MKTFNKSSLPDTIEYNGSIYKLNVSISSSMHLNDTPIATISATLKKEGKKAVLVICMSKNLKGKTDLHGKPYQPTKWIYTTIK